MRASTATCFSSSTTSVWELKSDHLINAGIDDNLLFHNLKAAQHRTDRSAEKLLHPLESQANAPLDDYATPVWKLAADEQHHRQ